MTAWILRFCIGLFPILVTAEPLDSLFRDLVEADSADAAKPIENQIWAQWMIGPTDEATSDLEQAVANINQGELTLALVRLNSLIDDQPDFTEAWNKRATLYFMLGQAEESIADIEQTLKREPRHFGAWSGLGLILERQGRLRAALTAHREVLKIYPASASSQQRIREITTQLLQQSI